MNIEQAREHGEGCRAAVKKVLVGRGKTEKEIDHFFADIFKDAIEEAMKRHHKEGVSHDETSIGFVRAYRAKLIEAGFAGVLPPEMP